MLLEMRIENFILIRKLNLSFKDQLNVFTGETGAGKSMIIGGINIGLGEKVTGDVVGFQAEKAVIQLVFAVNNPDLLDLLNDNGIDLEDEILIITREIFVSHRSVVRMNGRVVTLGLLKEASKYLIDIHGQHAHQALMYPKNHLHYLDLMGDKSHQDLIEDVGEAYGAIKNLQMALKDHEDKHMDVDRAYLKFQIQEIDSLNLTVDEEENLEQKYAYYKNIETIYANIHKIQEASAGEDNPYNLKETLTSASQWMHAIVDYDDKLKHISEGLNGLMYQLEDLNSEIRYFIDQLDVDEEEMYEVEGRMNAINELKMKHGKTVADILNKRNQLDQDLEDADNHQTLLETLKGDLQAKKKAYLKLASLLQKSRKAMKRPFEKSVMAQMAMLNMADGIFEVKFQEDNLEPGAFRLSKTGLDQVSFLISTNLGMALCPLSKVASGGEISRMMLAIKMALSHHDAVHTLVFDEVDTGISGSTALIVGEKMHQLTKNYQVLLITHLPQIAVMADRHFKIDKSVVDNITESSVYIIDERDKLKEMARMLSGAEDSDIAMENAMEMFNKAEIYKNSHEETV